MTEQTQPTDALAKLRHLYANMVNGGVRDTASAKRIAEGLLSPAIEALEKWGTPAGAGQSLTDSYVQMVPDKCDRIVWRNHYYHLPLTTPQPTQAQAGAVPLTSEQERAIREAYESAGSESYFGARPQIDTNDRRRVFKAGFERGWDAKTGADHA